MSLYDDLREDLADPQAGDAVFVCGARCAAEVDLGCHRVGRVATAPVDVLTELRLTLAGETGHTVSLFANHVEKEHRFTDGLTAHSTWFAAADLPVFVVWWRIRNAGDRPADFRIEGAARCNVNYISKFRRYANDTAEVQGDRLFIRDQAYPELVAALGLAPAWEECGVAAEGSAELGPGLDRPGQVVARFTGRIEVPPTAEVWAVLAFSGSPQPDAARDAVDAALRDPEPLFAAAHRDWERHLAEGVRLETPDRGLNAFFLHSKLWGYKDRRLVPLGAPFDLDRRNADILALTASPDYHGIFANDNGQSAWEYGALGPAYYPVLDNTLEVLYRYGTPESVEVDPVDATGRPWLSPLRIGQRPEWVMGAAALILWSAAYVEKYWPRIQEVLAAWEGDDRDGDALDDDSISTYPEQPDPGAYNHEMLYASAFWHQAFESAAQAARLVGAGGRAAEYAAQAGRIGQAIEERFGSPFGYASWLDAEHRQHPHRGHNMVLPVLYGIAPEARAQLVLDTLTRPPVMSPDGPLAGEPAYPMAGGAHAWSFARWNLVQALFLNGRPSQGYDLLLRWSRQEAALHHQAPEGFPTITGVTGKGYSWTAGRALRAIMFGLFGIALAADGFYVRPYLPPGWEQMALRNFPFRGRTYDIMVRRGIRRGLNLDGVPLDGALVRPAGEGTGARHEVVAIEL